jgi:superfamily II DNA or RNA helicase/HKD family nuclease
MVKKYIKMHLNYNELKMGENLKPVLANGIYEELVTQLVNARMHSLDQSEFYIHTTALDKEEAAIVLAQHLSRIIRFALGFVTGENKIERQIEIANKIMLLLKSELSKEKFDVDLVAIPGRMLKAVFTRLDQDYSDLYLRLKEIMPETRLSQSVLFTGSNEGRSLGSELRKEILSADEIDLLVSFIKFKGIIILEKELREFTQRGGKLRVITTTYMGATDYKAIELLANLPNTQVKVSYNTGNERLHAKAYLFKRKSGFDTAYIGSSNFSRTALTDGLEWNIKMTTREVSHIIDAFRKTYDSYWEDKEFEWYTPGSELHREKLVRALQASNSKQESISAGNYFKISPFEFQAEILEKLKVERNIHARNRNLVVAATGTGKTVIAAFDYRDFRKTNPRARLLFLAHRKEILVQAQALFNGILEERNFGELWVEGNVPASYQHVFASVQTLNNQLAALALSPEYYDFIVIDECHHLTASSYRDIIAYFKPKVLVGLTATPERMDGGDIQEDFHNRIAAEIRLPEALNRKLLCPFQYFGVSDSIDLSHVAWERGRYIPSELSKIYTGNDQRVRDILNALEYYTKDSHQVRALGFCVTVDHAQYMAEKFTLAGLKADFLTSANSQRREELRNKLKRKEINYLFVVDIFNEGVDIPEIDTVLFLRPTESLTIFLQQLGRGLRLADDKDCLTVLDFVGNARPEYNFENKFRALIGRTETTVKKEVEENFPHLPLGCSIVLEAKAKEVILKNISAATSLNRSQLIRRMQEFRNHSLQEFNLRNFLHYHELPIQMIYRKGGWKRLCYEAGIIETYDDTNEDAIIRAIRKKWLATRSTRYFDFILGLARRGFQVSMHELNEEEYLMLQMLHVDVWPENSGFESLQASIRALGQNNILLQEIIEVLEYLNDSIGFEELPLTLPYAQPLKIHARYTRDQILAAFRFSEFGKRASNREGVAEKEELKTELLFINLIKSEENFSPTTMYDDYAISESLFHWQTQNSAGPDTPKGLSYIHHKKNNKNILLFIREKKTDEFDQTMGYVFVGSAVYEDHSGSKPMSIRWKLQTPLPHYLWKQAAKLRVG